MTATTPSTPIRLFRHPLSGHCHRVELFLSLLGLPVDLVHVDLLKGAHKQPQFLARNPLGQVPVIEDGEVTLADSNAILVYLAAKYGDDSWLPREPLAAAHVQRFLSIAAGEVAKGPASARLVKVFGLPIDLKTAQTIAGSLLAVLEQQLAKQPFLSGDNRTIADIACYSYIAHAPEGGISLDPYPQVRGWLARIEALPGFIPMQAADAAKAA